MGVRELGPKVVGRENWVCRLRKKREGEGKEWGGKGALVSIGVPKNGALFVVSQIWTAAPLVVHLLSGPKS